jgi:hypothetical protein
MATFDVQLAAAKQETNGVQLSGIGNGAFATGEASASMGGGEAGVYVLDGTLMFWIIEGHPNTPPAKMEALAKAMIPLIASGSTSTPSGGSPSSGAAVSPPTIKTTPRAMVTVVGRVAASVKIGTVASIIVTEPRQAPTTRKTKVNSNHEIIFRTRAPATGSEKVRFVVSGKTVKTTWLTALTAK